MKFFGVQADRDIYADDAVICSTEFSKIVPLENGEVSFFFKMKKNPKRINYMWSL